MLEVGLGGRLDSTNIAQPIAAAITSIDFDHEQYLGHTLAAIAAEKAGVIRRGIPVVVGPVAPEARDVIVSMCEMAGGEYIEADAGVSLQSKTEDGRTSVQMTTPMRDYGWVALGLRGDHQVPNAVVAVRLLEALERQLPIAPDSIIAGLRDVRWPGRLQMLEVPGGRRVLLDAAHNPAGAWALASYLKREFPEPLPMVFGALRDKDVSLMLKALLPAASVMVMTAAGYAARTHRRRSWRPSPASSSPPRKSRWNPTRPAPSRARGRIARSSARPARFSSSGICSPASATTLAICAEPVCRRRDCRRRRRMLSFDRLLFPVPPA